MECDIRKNTKCLQISYKKMISAIITAYKEPKTIQKAIISLAEQPIKDMEVIVVAPDRDTLSEARKLKKKYKKLRVIEDDGLGKSAALNKSLKKIKGDILVLTDGDVYVGEKSISELLKPLEDRKVGAVSGNPVSINSKRTMFGFWSFVLTRVANKRRKRAVKNKKRIFCSGYLFAIRKELLPNLPEGLLSEDGYISHNVYQKNYKIGYKEDSIVFVKFPTNFKDWINQKRRGMGGYNQMKKIHKKRIRSFRKESMGFFDFFKYVSSLKELTWLLALFLARVYVWVLVYRDVNWRKRKREDLWGRVESTK